jgi:carbamoyltransferase
MVYGAVTEFLGYRQDSDEWKVMALAAYADGDNEYLEPMRRLIRVEENGTFSVALEYFAYYNFSDPRWYSDRFVRVFGSPRTPQEAITERHMRIAAALQRVFEESINQDTALSTPARRPSELAVSGGCFMNSVFNGKITSVSPFEECFISSCPDDSGTSDWEQPCTCMLSVRASGRPPTPATTIGA